MAAAAKRWLPRLQQDSRLPDCLKPPAETKTGGTMGSGEKKAAPEKGKVQDEDPLSQCLGHFGKYQLMITFFLALFNIPCTFHIFAPTFEGAQPDDFWCARPANLRHIPHHQWKNLTSAFTLSPGGGEVAEPCRIKALDYESLSSLADLREAARTTSATKACTAWEYDVTNSGQTTVSEWDLVCDNKEWANVSEMLFLFGVAVGGLTGSLSDKFGRRKLLVISVTLQACLGLLIAFVPWFSVYLVLRTLLGFFCVSIVFSGFVLCMELVGGKWLTISGVSYLMPVSLGYILMAGLAYLVRGWRKLQLIITVPSLVMLSLAWVLPESPRWLLAVGNSDRAARVVERAAAVNTISLPHDYKEILQQGCAVSKSKEEEAGGGTFSGLLGTPFLRKVTGVLCIVWFTNYFLYYGLVLNMAHIGPNVYLSSVISGCVELGAVAASIPVLLKMGRRLPVCLTLVCGGLACILSTLPSQDSQLSMSLAMVGKLCVSGTNVMLPVFTAELLPTLVRNLGIGVCNIASGLALLFIPYLWNMAWMGAGLPMCTLGSGGLLGGALVLLLPETSQSLSGSTQQQVGTKPSDLASA